MWRTYKAANRPWPVLDKDDVIDYMVMEAVSMKIRKEDNEAEKQQERKSFKKDHSKLAKYR